MKHCPVHEKSFPLFLFLVLAFAGCQEKAQGPHHFIKLKADGKPSKALFDSAVMVLDQRLNLAYDGDVTVRADGKTIVLEVAGRPNLDSLAVLVLSKGGFGMYETYNKNEVVDATANASILPSGASRPVTRPEDAQLVYAFASDTARMRKSFVDRNESLLNAIFVWGAEETFSHTFPLYALKRPVAGGPVISKIMVEKAATNFDERGKPCITIRLKNAYIKTWHELTRANLGRTIAIRFGRQVLSAPRVIGEIPGGDMQITGDFTLLQSRMLAAMILAPDLQAALLITDVDTALFVPLSGYPTVKQQARYEAVRAELFLYKPKIDSLLGLVSAEQRSIAQRDLERIYLRDIVDIATEAHATQAEVDEFITKTEAVLEGMKRRLEGKDDVSASDLQRMLEGGAVQ